MKKTPNKYMVGVGIASVVATAAAVAISPAIRNMVNDKRANGSSSMD